MATDADSPCGSKRNGLYESTNRSEPLFTGVNLTVFERMKNYLKIAVRFSIALRREGVAVRKWIADIRTSIPSRQSGAFDSGSIDGYSLIISLHEMSAHQGRQRSIDSHLIHRKRSPFSSKEKERVVEDANPYGVICICAAEWNANLSFAAHPVKKLPQTPHNRFWLHRRLVLLPCFHSFKKRPKNWNNKFNHFVFVKKI